MKPKILVEVTDANGDYRIVVLSGTGYKLTFIPPIPPL